MHPINELPSWVRLGGKVIELSQTRGIVLNRAKIKEITDTEIVLWGQHRYRISSMQPAEESQLVVFTRQNAYLPLCETRLASPEHPEAQSPV